MYFILLNVTGLVKMVYLKMVALKISLKELIIFGIAIKH